MNDCRPLPTPRLALAMLAFALAACTPRAGVSTPARATDPPRADGRTVLRAMHERYGGKWYMSLSFKQNVVIIGQTGRETKQVWNEYITLPGRLRIDYLPLASKGGVLYADGKMYGFAGGKQSAVQQGWHPLLSLMGDVYTQLPDTTALQLDSIGFDLDIARKDKWEGKEVWVVGAVAGDSTTSQFWVDVDSLLVRRIVQRDTRSLKPVVTDTRFLSYRNLGGFPVAFSLRSYRDGRLYFKQDYFNAKVGERLPVELFEPRTWATSQLKR